MPKATYLDSTKIFALFRLVAIAMSKKQISIEQQIINSADC